MPWKYTNQQNADLQPLRTKSSAMQEGGSVHYSIVICYSRHLKTDNFSLLIDTEACASY